MIILLLILIIIARLWNSLPSHVTAAPSISIACLKSHLFSLSYLAFWLFPHLYCANAVTRHFRHYNRYYIYHFTATVNWGKFGHPPLVTVTPQCSNGGWPKLPQLTVSVQRGNFDNQQLDKVAGSLFTDLPLSCVTQRGRMLLGPTKYVAMRDGCQSIVKRRQVRRDGYANINVIPSVTATAAAAAAVVSVEVPQWLSVYIVKVINHLQSGKYGNKVKSWSGPVTSLQALDVYI